MLDTSFEVADFDPLNQNAKKLPSFVTGFKPSIHLTCGPSATNSDPTPNYNTYTPVYPTLTSVPANHPKQASFEATDTDVELLRKYGLDKFSLAGEISIDASKIERPCTSATAIQTKTHSTRSKWTDFD